MKPLAIYGAGSLGQETLMLIHQINEYQEQWKLIGFFDDDDNEKLTVDGMPILGGIPGINAFKDEINLVVAIGNPKVRKRIVNKITNPLVTFATIIHPSVQWKPYQNISIGEGCIISAGNIMTIGIRIGKHVVLNMGCTIGHDAVIGDYTSIMPGCIISGGAQIGSDCFIGAGAAIMNRVEIPDSARVSAREIVNFGVPKILE